MLTNLDILVDLVVVNPPLLLTLQGRKILEINPEHEILRGIKTLLSEKDEDRARDLAELLYETSLITSGFQVDSPKDYASKVFTLMRIALGQDPSMPAAPEVSGSSSSSSEAAPAVEAQVIDPTDPWSSKKQ